MIEWISDVLDVLWVGWILFWLGEPLYENARGKSKRVVSRGRGYALSYILLLGAFGTLQISFTGQLAFLSIDFLPDTPPVGIFGLGLAVAGLAFSIWARLYLGSNWSPSAMLKEGQTLVKTGPYAIVRHPIYLGLTVAMIGTGIVFGGYRIIVSITCMLLFSWLRITEEERLMAHQFSENYAKYKEEVKAFIPGII
ncbi:MAG: methyltransferase family protein [Nitrososphaerales archaeon]